MQRPLVILLALGSIGLTYHARALADDTQPAAVTPAPRDEGWMKVHEAINSRAKQGDVDLIFIGDSITEGWGNRDTWQKFYGDRKPLNAGISGDETQHVLWRLDNGNIEGIKPKLAVIMIGTNNNGNAHHSAEDIAAGIKAIVAKLRTKLPATKILLLGIFPRSKNPDDPARQVNEKANELARTVADGKHVFYLDIGAKFREPDGTISQEIMPDYLHLSPKGYEIWATSIEPEVSRLLGDSPKS